MDGQEEKPPKIFQIYSTDELFPSNKKTEILSTLKKHKQIDILHFSKRKDEAMKFLNEGNIQKAIEYDNTSYDINRDYSKLIIQNNEILNLFNENLNKNNLQELIKEIINSVQWNEEKIKDKYNEYKNDINNRYKFNQPIDINNTSLYFYNTRIHILFSLLESDNISQFKKKLEKKRKIYNKINIINIIDKNEYPKVKNKLKYLMLILIKADNEEDANYMINSIFSEKENIKECFEEMKKFISNISYNEIEETIFINEIPIKKKFFSFKSILSYIKEFPVYSLYNDYLYNYEYFLESYWINSIYENLKQLIRVIFKSKIYANILNELFKKSQFEIEFIQSDDFIQFLLSKINFIPISTYQIPFLDKLSLDIFLGGYDNYLINNNNSNYKTKIKHILKIGCNIIYIIHEGGGHFIYSYFTIISNNYYEFGSPKIQINKKWIKNESGEQVELLLFGRVTSIVKLKEILFILNSKNYEIYNNFDEFRNNFILSNNKEYEDLTKEFKGPFSRLINEIKWNEIEDNRDFPISISTKNKNDQQPSITIHRSQNDTLGKTFDY